jgi:hypothetical protein
MAATAVDRATLLLDERELGRQPLVDAASSVAETGFESSEDIPEQRHGLETVERDRLVLVVLLGPRAFLIVCPAVHVWIRFVMPTTIDPRRVTVVERELRGRIDSLARIPPTRERPLCRLASQACRIECSDDTDELPGWIAARVRYCGMARDRASEFEQHRVRCLSGLVATVERDHPRQAEAGALPV